VIRHKVKYWTFIPDSNTGLGRIGVPTGIFSVAGFSVVVMGSVNIAVGTY
jgi:hypothetical protein